MKARRGEAAGGSAHGRPERLLRRLLRRLRWRLSPFRRLAARMDRERRERKQFEKWQRLQLVKLRADVREGLRAAERRQEELRERFHDIQHHQRLARRARAKGFQKVDALLRNAFLADLVADEMPQRVTARRFNLLSQNEEDGIVLALLQLCGVKTRRFVELGSGMNGGNSGLLARELGWRGLMVERDPRRVQRCAEDFADGERVRCVCAEVTPENVDRLIAEHGLAGEVDVFSLDIDSFDYWVLEAMTACKPRLMVLEYNAGFGPEAAVTVPRDAPLAGAPKGYHGASLAALTRLAETRGHRLVACDPSGTNAFFLRDDLAPEIPALPVAEAFRPQASRPGSQGDGRPRSLDLLALAEAEGLPLHYL